MSSTMRWSCVIFFTSGTKQRICIPFHESPKALRRMAAPIHRKAIRESWKGRHRWADSFACMNTTGDRSLISLWQQRVIGGLWALLGLACILHSFQMARMEQMHRSQAWFWALFASPYVVAEVGFLLVRTWARRALGTLMVVSGLLFADWILAGLMLGSQSLLWLSLGGFGFTIYSAAFVLCSRVRDST